MLNAAFAEVIILRQQKYEIRSIRQFNATYDVTELLKTTQDPQLGLGAWRLFLPVGMPSLVHSVVGRVYVRNIADAVLTRMPKRMNAFTVDPFS
ncbi:hypothetical protein N7456_004982 [Penicillium angulare]|uniref:Uncharacterized protein n=1 Tax=Penicillium angulare TaxID=116970 RepID=A0A9W9FZ86_9EURO|nr:hypothetical protein N7456_004982 [Penicillium angulare]